MSAIRSEISLRLTSGATVLLLLILIALLTGSCRDCVTAEGPLRSEYRDASTVTEVELAGDVDVVLVPSDTPFIHVEARENVLELIETEIRGVTVRISTKECLDLNEETRIRIGMKDLHMVIVGGSGNISSEGLFLTEEVQVAISGSGEARLNLSSSRITTSINGSGVISLFGFADYLKVNIAGSGNLACPDLHVDECEALIAGSGTAELSVSRSLKARVNGSGNILYTGNPELDTRVTGSGSINKQ